MQDNWFFSAGFGGTLAVISALIAALIAWRVSLQRREEATRTDIWKRFEWLAAHGVEIIGLRSSINALGVLRKDAVELADAGLISMIKQFGYILEQEAAAQQGQQAAATGDR